MKNNQVLCLVDAWLNESEFLELCRHAWLACERRAQPSAECLTEAAEAGDASVLWMDGQELGQALLEELAIALYVLGKARGRSIDIEIAGSYSVMKRPSVLDREGLLGA